MALKANLPQIGLNSSEQVGQSQAGSPFGLITQIAPKRQ